MRTVMPVSAFGYKCFKRLNDSPFILFIFIIYFVYIYVNIARKYHKTFACLTLPHPLRRAKDYNSIVKLGNTHGRTIN